MYIYIYRQLTNRLGYIIAATDQESPHHLGAGGGGSVSFRDITHLIILSDFPEHSLSIICTESNKEVKFQVASGRKMRQKLILITGK